MFHGNSWDFQWLSLFSRLSCVDTSDVDWDPYLPFLFNLVGNYLTIPISPLDVTNLSINDYQIDMYRVFFLEVSSCVDLLPLFTEIIVNLLTSKSKDGIRKYLETTIFLLKPYCSPLAQADEDPTPEIALIFFNSLIQQYIKRISSERKNAFRRLPKLTQEDNEWFVNLLLPVIQIERFCSDTRITSLKDFCSLAPTIAIPEMLNTAMQVIEYERLQASAVKTIIALIPICIYFDIGTFQLHDFIVKFSELLNVIDIDQALRIFSLFSVYVSCVGIQEEDYEMNLKVTKKAIDFVEKLSETDYDQCADVPNSCIAICSANCSRAFIKELIDYFLENFNKLQPYVISDVCRAFGPAGVEFLLPKVFEATKLKEYALLRGFLRMHYGLVIPHYDKIMECVERGLRTDEKKIQRIASQCIKMSLLNLLQTAPLFQQANGFTTVEDAKINWHIPNDDEFACADRICAKVTEWSESFLSETGDIAKQLIGISLISNMAKGIKYVISNTMFDVIEKEDMSKQPFLTHIECPLLKKHWQYMLTRLSGLLDPDGPEKLINATLKLLPSLLIPRDHVQLDTRDEKQKMKSMKELLAIGVTSDVVTYRLITRNVMQMYTFRNAVTITPYTKQIDEIIKRTAILCTYPKTRNRCALFVQETSAVFPDHFGPFFETLIWTTEECIDDSNKLSGLAQSLCSCCQLVFTADSFSTIAKAALLVCRPISNDIPEDSVRSLRQFIIMTFDVVDLNEKRFNEKEFLSTRMHIIKTAIERYEKSGQDREVETYSTALVMSMAQNRPELMTAEVFQFLLSKLSKEDPSLSEVVMQVMPNFVEQLIARVPRRERVHYDKITPENYDTAYFKDRFLKGLSSREPEFLSVDELLDEATVGRYFDNPQQRVPIHKLMIDYFLTDETNVHKICMSLVDSQVHQEESYSKMRVQFWVSIIRLLGTPFALLLIQEMEQLTKENSIVAMHVIAGELFSSVMFALKRWKYAEIQKIVPHLLQFIGRVVREGESDFQSVWFVSIVCGLSDHDPRRFIWLFEHLLSSSIPEHITQIREVKAASLVVDILLEFAWRVPELIQPIIQKAVLPMFEEKAQQFEQIRECSIRAVSSLFSTFFKLDDPSLPSEVQDLFENVLTKAGDSFLVAWLTAQFTTQALSSFVVNRLALDKISGWLDICLGKTEDEEKRARGCLLHLIRSNWLWTCARSPLTKESALPVIQKVFDQLVLDNRRWQGQAVILFLNSAFYEANFFFIGDQETEKLVNKIIRPALESNNYDVQESATEVFAFILKSSQYIRLQIPSYLDYYRVLLFTPTEPINKRIAGVKGLISIIQSTLLFGTLPNYVIEAFEMLLDAQSNPTLEPHISLVLSDFWSIHDQNLTQDVLEQLAPFKDTVRPSYFC